MTTAVAANNIPYGLIGLTAAYIGMVIAIEYKVPIDCMFDDSSKDNTKNIIINNGNINEKCQSEGVDNTILNWSSDFFIATCMFLFAFQLSICQKTTKTTTTSTTTTTIDEESNDNDETSNKTNDETNNQHRRRYRHHEIVRNSGILVQVFMAGTFTLSGIGCMMFPNSGVDDNRGMVGYWICWITRSLFFTISALCTAHFALEATSNLDPTFLANQKLLFGRYVTVDLESKKLRLWFVVVSEIALVLSLTGFLTGSIWCATDPDLNVDDNMDVWLPLEDATTSDSDEERGGIAECFAIAKYSELAMNVSYALLWIPLGLLFRAGCEQKPKSVFGLSTKLAASIIPTTIQWTFGSFLPVLVLFVSSVATKSNNKPSSYFDVWNTIYGTVLYHWSMLITLYCVHNLSCGLTVRVYDEEGIIDRGICQEDDDDEEERAKNELDDDEKKKKKDYDNRNDDNEDDSSDNNEPQTFSWDWLVSFLPGNNDSTRQADSDISTNNSDSGSDHINNQKRNSDNNNNNNKNDDDKSLSIERYSDEGDLSSNNGCDSIAEQISL